MQASFFLSIKASFGTSLPKKLPCKFQKILFEKRNFFELFFSHFLLVILFEGNSCQLSLNYYFLKSRTVQKLH